MSGNEQRLHGMPPGTRGLGRVSLVCSAALLAVGCAAPARPSTTVATRDAWPALEFESDGQQQDAAPDADDAEALAKKLANPVAALISVPFQANYDRGYNPDHDGSVSKVNVQPVVPFTLNEDWNLISRTILPIISQEQVGPGTGQQQGVGDITQSLFFSPAKPVNGWIWGAGPVFLIPTATNPLLGAGKTGLGPTAVVLRQDGPWTTGALANHIWSEAGDSDRASINATYLQPFVAYTTREAWTYTLNTESTYDWNQQEWSVPVNAMVSKVTRIGSQLVSIGAGVRWWVDSPPGGPEGWGARLTFTLLYPR